MKFDLEQFKQGVKARTRDGRIATFVGICEYCHEYQQIVVYVEGCPFVLSFNTNGKYMQDEVHVNDLVSMVSPWESVPIDAKVRVKNHPETPWCNYHYAGLEEGKPTTWQFRRTSWSAEGNDDLRVTWKFMELVND